MSDNADTAVENTDDLDAFEADFYGTAKVVVEDAEDDPEIEGHDGDDAPEIEDDKPEAEDEDGDAEPDGEEDEPEEKPKPKGKKSFKDRIDELTADKYEERRAREAAEKKAADLEARLAKLEAGKVDNEKKEPTLREKLPDDAPHPDARGEDGELLYPLGDYDPQYIADLSRYAAKMELAKAREEAEKEDRERAFAAEKQQIADNWAEKLDEFEAEVPEVRENIKGLTDAFQSLEPSYGEYLAMTIMGLDHGVEVMHYLSKNIAEAQRLVAQGPLGATLALGRLEAKFEKNAAEQEEKRQQKVSKAPKPPEAVSRGQGGRFTIRGDTDDLDAFEREFLKP